MKLTREQRQTLDKMSIKERVERLEELTDQIQNVVSDMHLNEFNKEIDEICDKSDTQCMWAMCVAMVVVGAALGVGLSKLL